MVSDRALAGSVLLLGALILAGLIGPVLWPRSDTAIDLANALVGPSWSHPMGTDGNGRDILIRFIVGTRISLVIAAIVVLLGTLVGGGIGVVGAVAGGWVDQVLMRIVDVVLSFPPLILAMAITVGLGSGLVTATIGIALTCVPYYARLVRSDVLRVRGLPYVEASIAIGARPIRVVMVHIVPQTASTMLIQSAAVFGYAILTLAALGFVGLGAQIPTPEWGAMITDGLQYVVTGQWWVAFFPGLGVLLAVVGMNVLADRVRDRLDPHGTYGLM